ncbi:peptide deformylase [Candidatus Roizmanbacteria bacterium CG2_30_33_16]|uniref:Peptide deformylase n=2 Tax=Candidatus Roizmaniibacteriota TaxID=1752723 RepID=A0A2M7LNT9_9BACT|nr:MAG: peptide deformylase [Candidatus Roizmanbacteria bacterium CG2_30_33_16]PIX69714.1 MAG: peptide deformylase [Candidatus Roizmanbacteria bacterium CG_4_10_14_3_um_filter_33_21]
MLKVVNVPNSILTIPVKPVVNFDQVLLKLVKEMKKTLEAQIDPPGVGLAAPQIGKSLALFIIKPKLKALVEVFINPRILQSEEFKVMQRKSSHTKKKQPLEGCLSIPHIWGPVKRANKILLEYQNINGKTITEWFSGFKAVIIQHEVDHLSGILFTHRSLEQKAPLYEEENGELIKIKY